jgi:hypothetical protein
VASFRTGTVVEIIDDSKNLVRMTVELDETIIPAVGFPSMLGPVVAGDRVVVNTTGIDLELGSGGDGFVLWNLNGPGPDGPGPGHIIKLRYTPWQTEVLAAEAPESPHHERLEAVTSIAGMPVVVCGLHSQVAGVAAGIRERARDARIGYLMTDGGALPLAWSNLVRDLETAGLLDVTCTCGHAFGGRLEAVNEFSGLAALRHAGGADIVVAAMGPGVVGTASALGFTAMEQGQLLDATTALGGRAIACLRLTFSDDRERHRGMSHHSMAALTIAARERATVVVPQLGEVQSADVRAAMTATGLDTRHDIVAADGGPGLALLQELGVRSPSMGRSPGEVPELFLAAAAAGRVGAERL